MENKTSIVKTSLKVLLVIASLVISASVWTIPHWGGVTGSYTTLTHFFVASGICVIGGLIILAFLSSLRDLADNLCASFAYFGLIISFIAWFAIMLSSTPHHPSDAIVWDGADATARADVSDETRIYPFWNDDFKVIENTNSSVSYTIYERCDDGNGSCAITAEMSYSVDPWFINVYSGVITDYELAATYALTASMLRDDAYTNIQELEEAFCSNFRDQAGLEDLDTCPFNLSGSITVTREIN